MAPQASIKMVIEILCSICEKLGFSKVLPDLFRQAKFNSDDATGALWILLYEMLYFAAYKKTPQDMKDFDSTIASLKAIFSDLGYRVKEFYQLSSSSLQGSRELLIAFGWLIGKRCIFEVLIEYTMVDCLDLVLLNDGEYNIESKWVKFASLSDHLNHILVLFNRSKMEWKSLRQLVKFLAKKATHLDCKVNVNDSFLQQFLNGASVLELSLLLQNEKSQVEVLGILKKKQALLNVYFKWIKYGELFWNWMSSVVNEKAMFVHGTDVNSLDFCDQYDHQYGFIFSEDHGLNEQAVGMFLDSKIEVQDISYPLLKLMYQLVDVNWAASENYRCVPSINCNSEAKFSHGSDVDPVEGAIMKMSHWITRTECRIKLLEEKVQNSLTLGEETDDHGIDDQMQKFIHLPFPKI